MKTSRIRKPVSCLKNKKHIEDVELFLFKIKEIKNKFWLSGSEIDKLLDKWYTFNEIIEWWFDKNMSFIPKNIIMENTKEYLLWNNKYNTYANQQL